MPATVKTDSVLVDARVSKLDQLRELEIDGLNIKTGISCYEAFSDVSLEV